MKQHLHQITLVVKEYDEAIAFYTQVLGFELIEDTQRTPTKRWVVVAPKGGNGCRLLLAKAKNAQELAAVGNQTGGRVFLFLHTDNFDEDYARLIAHDVHIVRAPAVEDFGKVCVFADLYGNLIDFIDPGYGTYPS
ncbi:VOC family protein [Marinoscillum furvescens]|uniref:Catechol 2,3-dioxygenase-like lactoylglutathione lyase family enzyme n=1 Tax=Marinoscillum furvescens DSM 4134 TaxID=1122208 RepID=A0A3D9KY65_MARFU|nr:VOC family protein [Marinoscillum furvescens]RED93209.1 catechol 2,3-dioxygenase-like lactoylglutathione lyase family enzyme [Marinoscillum furvescens DSM 4134]